MGAAKFGIRDDNGNLNDAKLRKLAAKVQVKMIKIKLAHGAKLGKGGIQPAAKIGAEISEIRGILESCDNISPNRHAEVDD
jgi:glutamate synthase domain-containing protein 2